jgi:indoleamine 2,3-dioxygenase
MEARGGAVIRKMLSMINAASANDPEIVTSYLLDLADCIAELGILLERMHEKCDPYVFCYQIRPFLAGSKNMTSAGLKNGVFYDEGNGQGRWHQYSGGSNAQSSLLQFFDIILGVEHRAPGYSPAKIVETPVGENPFIQVQCRHPAPKANITNQGSQQQMRKYMPGPHNRFLTWLSTHSTVRPYILTFSPNHKIVMAYNSAVAAFAGFRDKHLKLVARYIIAPSRNPKGPSSPLGERRPSSLNLASATKSNVDEPEKGHAQGTGGTALIPFLKQTREETRMAARG